MYLVVFDLNPEQAGYQCKIHTEVRETSGSAHKITNHLTVDGSLSFTFNLTYFCIFLVRCGLTGMHFIVWLMKETGNCLSMQFKASKLFIFRISVENKFYYLAHNSGPLKTSWFFSKLFGGLTLMLCHQ